MTVFCEVEHPSEEENTHALQSPMKTVILILPLDATTVNNPSDSIAVSAGVRAGQIAGVTAGALID